MCLKHCHNFYDFRILAKKRLPSPIFNYIDGGADDETTYRRNTAAFDTCDLIPSVLTGVEKALELMHAELERGMKLMGKTAISQLNHKNLRFRD
jgi:isopentenyl diphosphate isomerase/L-lactate dehydrogenase-like FMN-dependent dehydrogenase